MLLSNYNFSKLSNAIKLSISMMSVRGKIWVKEGGGMGTLIGEGKVGQLPERHVVVIEDSVLFVESYQVFSMDIG